MLFSSAQAQVAPPGLERCDTGESVTFLSDLSAEEHSHYWHATTQAAQGYLIIEVDARYQDLVRDFRSRSSAAVGHLDIAPQEVQLSGVFLESENRRNLFFKWADANVMLTKWRFRAEGAKLCFPFEFFNSRVGDQISILSLAISLPRTADILWKVTWLSAHKTEQFELYVEDKIVNGRPRMTPAQILQLAERLQSVLVTP